jgi:hypothetical protein
MKRKETKFYTLQVPAVSHEFASTLARAFPVMELKPGVSPDDAMFNAGQQVVVQWVLQHATGSKIIGDPNALRPTEVNKSLLDKILGSFKK